MKAKRIGGSVMMRIFKRFALWLLQGIFGLALLLFFLFMIMEWVYGCGETYTDSKGNTHTTECIHYSIYKAISK
jgi:hypothetical protein